MMLTLRDGMAKRPFQCLRMQKKEAKMKSKLKLVGIAGP